jgi:hypothetical protein
MDADRAQRLQDFVDWTKKFITGDEKGQADIFTAPGVPPTYGDPKPLITKDCIQP